CEIADEVLWRKDGTSFPADMVATPARGARSARGEPSGTVVAFRDVTERKAIERRLQELNTELEQANRAKDEFLASMSHELRTPLNAVIGFTGTLLMKLPGPLTAEQERQLQIVQSSARHLLSLINDILDLAKVEAGKVELFPEPVSVRAVVDQVAASLAASADAKNLQLVTEAYAADDIVMSDRRALHQIVLNLADNAIKYTDSGSVRITVIQEKSGGRSALAIAVADTGIGISPEDQAHLFEAFEQLDHSNSRRFPGTGLGLYLSRKLALLLGAELAVSSERGKGSTFTLTLLR
ncbi:MAG: PAS domain-containing sensor histidine kinase, partial [Candidatus Eremiobacteraeota bacterium]|nr:PAS domain-containing sensor histidine kinase [Candidatus Eremiobacteraeota bacterium]